MTPHRSPAEHWVHAGGLESSVTLKACCNRCKVQAECAKQCLWLVALSRLCESSKKPWFVGLMRCLLSKVALVSHLIKGALVATVKDICEACDVTGGAAEAWRARRGNSSNAHNLSLMHTTQLKACQQALQTNESAAASSCQGTGHLGSR